MASSPHLRRAPSQQRSRERVEAILDAAAAIVSESGTDALKVSDIARRAGVPLGTLYQFFARKDDVVLALAERFATRFGDVLERVLAEQSGEPTWRDLVQTLLDAYTEHYRSEPALRELWVGARLDPEFMRADHEFTNARFARTLAELMAPQALIAQDELRLMIYVTWEASQALLETAFRSSADGDPAIIEQASVMALRYLAPAFERPGGTGAA